MSWDIFPSWRDRSGTPERPKRRDHGLHVLVPAPGKASDRIDIVAIHGLNGHYLRTWTDERTGLNWLSDLIPRVIPAARVMSLSYNSVLQFSKSTADVSAFGRQLLEGLMAERQSEEEMDRPVLFICHSLGGLVFKQAYILASENTDYMALKPKFGGVLFFGTPHRGSNMASWATMAARLLSLASLNTSTNTQLAQDLEPSSKRLRSISDTFHSLCSRDQYPVMSCYETDRMSGLNTTVVDRESAVLGVPGEIVIAAEGDHRGICRFSDAEEKRFRPLAARLRKMAQLAIGRSSNLVQSLMSSLEKVNYKAHRARNPTAVEGTCRWILRHPRYQDWLHSTGASFLWISGDPGSGKSVLASFLVDIFTEMREKEDLNICYFFFKSDNLEQASAVNALQALLHQLFLQQTSLASTGVSLLPLKALEDIPRLWGAFMSLTGLGTTRTTICILDAVDECAATLRKELLSCITSLLSPEAGTECPGDDATASPTSALKLIVTSRPDNQIKVAFEKRPRLKGRPSAVPAVSRTLIRLRAEDEVDNIGDDITKVVEFKIEDLVESGLPRELMTSVQYELIARADRTFLWVSLVLNLLEAKVEAGASRRELDAVLKTRNIYSIYTQLLEGSSNSQRARKLLNIILAAARALTLEEVSVALAVTPENDILSQRRTGQPLKPGMVTLDDVEADISLPFENHVKSLCGHFVRIIRNKVYLVHETAREFLLSTSRDPPSPGTQLPGCQQDPEFETHRAVTISPLESATVTKNVSFQHSFTLLEARALLLEICVTYLYCLAKGSGGSTVPGCVTPLTKPFLHYVANSWFIHFHQVSHRLRAGDIRYFQNLCHPLFPGFRAWVEDYSHPYPPHQSGSIDEVQDYYVDLLDIELFSAALATNPHDRGQSDGGESGATVSDDEKESEEELDSILSGKGDDDDEGDDQWQRAGEAVPRWITGSACPSDPHPPDVVSLPASSNPTSFGNHNFPLRVQPTGMVSLDFPSIPDIGTRYQGGRGWQRRQ